MALTLENKKEVVAEMAAIASTSISAVAAEYRGMTVAQMTELRSRARKAGVVVRVVRNTLSRRALKDTQFECMCDSLTGPLFLAFSKDAPGAAARLLRDFGKETDKLSVVALALSGKLMGAEQLEAVANLPTYDEAIAKLMFILKEPITQLVRTINEPTAKLARTLAAVRDQKQAG